ncbi:hypothetical protein D3C71_929570 [compost metagenome]
MRSLTFISILLTVLLISCGSNEKPSKKDKDIVMQRPNFNRISMETIDDEGFLEDSVEFYNFVCEIVSNNEYTSDKEFIPGCETITSRMYEFVYQTPDSIISLTRKMDLLEMFVVYYRRGVNYYLMIVENKLEQNKNDITSRSLLLFPFIHSNKLSKKLVKSLLKHDKIEVPLEYVKYSSQILKRLNTLPKKNLEESFKRLHSDHYSLDPDLRMFLSKRFQDKYSCLSCWKTSPFL